MKTLKPVPSNCTGCRLCLMACSFRKDNAFSEARTRLKIRADEIRWKFEPVVCRQCADAPCAAACPTAAISRDPRTSAVVLEASKCSGCEACVLACPFEAIRMDRTIQIPHLCDLCGGSPECVAACPHGAIVYSDDIMDDGIGRTGSAIWFGEALLK
jgi:carbon-monoxide dehydrogenase iron sulfur subunit